MIQHQPVWWTFVLKWYSPFYFGWKPLGPKSFTDFYLSCQKKKKNFHRLDNWMRVPIKLLWLHLLKALEIRQIENPFRPIRPGVAKFQGGVSVLYSTYPSRKWKKSLVVSVGKQWKKETFQLLQSEDRKVWGKYYLEPCCKVETGERRKILCSQLRMAFLKPLIIDAIESLLTVEYWPMMSFNYCMSGCSKWKTNNED